jgi:WD40 repeat protein
MMATCSTDEYIKIWDIANNNGTEPKLIGAKKTTMGELFTLSFYKDIPWVLAAGGSKGEVAVWDTEENDSIGKHFASFLDKTRIPEVVSEDSQSEEDKESDDEEEKKRAKKERREKAAANKEKKK